ncbi:hypothetical protein CDD80_4229 [Ophiocordyceps camponoti-rufipedis]|uniref:Uncharacterized protein n=1 Tax=Ophiocordyceps camponoti-rufipedis TaxID=2004952 RepID=A0A2C5ZJM9_9HYPO|nr:hypothetical protein CDD80_4229 [Ophiocordyceps camponoti-rufipedis]
MKACFVTSILASMAAAAVMDTPTGKKSGLEKICTEHFCKKATTTTTVTPVPLRTGTPLSDSSPKLYNRDVHPKFITTTNDLLEKRALTTTEPRRNAIVNGRRVKLYSPQKHHKRLYMEDPADINPALRAAVDDVKNGRYPYGVPLHLAASISARVPIPTDARFTDYEIRGKPYRRYGHGPTYPGTLVATHSTSGFHPTVTMASVTAPPKTTLKARTTITFRPIDGKVTTIAKDRIYKILGKETQTAVKGTQTAAKETQTAIKETQTQTAIKETQTQTAAKGTQTAVKETQTTGKETQTAVKGTQTAVKETQTAVKQTQTAVKQTQTPPVKQTPVKDNSKSGDAIDEVEKLARKGLKYIGDFIDKHSEVKKPNGAKATIGEKIYGLRHKATKQLQTWGVVSEHRYHPKFQGVSKKTLQQTLKHLSDKQTKDLLRVLREEKNRRAREERRKLLPLEIEPVKGDKKCKKCREGPSKAGASSNKAEKCVFSKGHGQPKTGAGPETSALSKTPALPETPALPKTAALPTKPDVQKTPALAKLPAPPKTPALPKLPALPKRPALPKTGMPSADEFLAFMLEAVEKEYLKRKCKETGSCGPVNEVKPVAGPK